MKIARWFPYSTFLVLSGCVITNTPGFYSGYEKLDSESKQNIVFLPDEKEICTGINDRRIYAIKAAQLLKCLEANESSVVYFWSANCSSTSCISLQAAQKYCDRNNQELYVVLEYYDDMEKISIQNATTRPLFSIDHKFYRTDYCNKYTRLFTQELLQHNPPIKERANGRFYVFNYGRLVTTKKDLLEGE